jgi:hypothetical protein
MVVFVEGRTVVADMARPRRLPGVDEQGTCTGGSPGTWEILAFPPMNGTTGPPLTQSSRPLRDRFFRWWERMNGTRGGTAKRRKRSAAGRKSGSRSAP